jgi:hypothetical protein
MERARTSKILVIVYQTTRCHIPEENNLHNRRRDFIKPHNIKMNLKYAEWEDFD